VNKLWYIVGGVVLGYVLAPQVAKLPLVNKLPQF
jgi:hypothetical protein